jgi:anti-anti-sigma regulatory factor
MSENTIGQAHIAYELIDEHEPKVLVIEFLTHSIIDPTHGRELGEQLRSLIQPAWPCRFVLDFKNIRMLGSRAFGEIALFVREVRSRGGTVKICRIDDMTRLGAAMVGLDDPAEFATDRRSAIEACLRAAERGMFVDSNISG